MLNNEKKLFCLLCFWCVWSESAEKGHIFKYPIHFAHKNILIGDVSGEPRNSSRTKEIKGKNLKKDYGFGHRMVLKTSKIEKEGGKTRD